MYFGIYVAGIATATLFFFLIFCVTEHRRKKRKKLRKKVKIDTFVKAATTIVLGHGLIMITMSYILAWFGKDTVVDVSTTLITEVVAPLCLYMGTNCIMNIFEKNELSFSKPIQMQKVRDVWDGVHSETEDTEDCPDEGVSG